LFLERKLGTILRLGKGVCKRKASPRRGKEQPRDHPKGQNRGGRGGGGTHLEEGRKLGRKGPRIIVFLGGKKKVGFGQKAEKRASKSMAAWEGNEEGRVKKAAPGAMSRRNRGIDRK